MPYFKKYSDEDSIVCTYHNTLNIELSQDTIIQIENCAIVCAFNLKNCNIYGSGITVAEFSNDPNNNTIEYIRSNNGPLILSNISGPNSFVVDIYGNRYFSL